MRISERERAVRAPLMRRGRSALSEVGEALLLSPLRDAPVTEP